MVLRKTVLLGALVTLLLSCITTAEASEPYFYATNENSIKPLTPDVNGRLSSDCKLYVYDTDGVTYCKAYFGNSKSNKFVAKSTRRYVNALSSIEITCGTKDDVDIFCKVVSATMSAVLPSWDSSGMKSNFERTLKFTAKELPYKKTFTSVYWENALRMNLEYKVSASSVHSVKITTDWIRGR